MSVHRPVPEHLLPRRRPALLLGLVTVLFLAVLATLLLLAPGGAG